VSHRRDGCLPSYRYRVWRSVIEIAASLRFGYEATHSVVDNLAAAFNPERRVHHRRLVRARNSASTGTSRRLVLASVVPGSPLPNGTTTPCRGVARADKSYRADLPHARPIRTTDQIPTALRRLCQTGGRPSTRQTERTEDGKGHGCCMEESREEECYPPAMGLTPSRFFFARGQPLQARLRSTSARRSKNQWLRSGR
jgi:hypothetical protein